MLPYGKIAVKAVCTCVCYHVVYGSIWLL